MEMKKLNFLEKKLYTKHKILLDYVKDKRIVHYGCIDDSTDIIDSKIKNNIYLHKLLSDASSSCIGVDINTEIMTYLKETHTIDNIVYGNVEDPKTFEIDLQVLKEAEVLVIPDLIEHLNNPGLMIESFRKYYSSDIKIIILTPNPFSYLNFAFTLLGREFYNAYHTCYFSTNNMKVLLKNHAIKINRVFPVFMPKDRSWFVKFIDKTINYFLTIFTYGFCDNYLYECELDEQ